MIRRLTGVFLGAALCLAMCTVSLAADRPHYALEASVEDGWLCVTLALADCEGVEAFSVNLEYDPDMLIAEKSRRTRQSLDAQDSDAEYTDIVNLNDEGLVQIAGMFKYAMTRDLMGALDVSYLPLIMVRFCPVAGVSGSGRVTVDALHSKGVGIAGGERIEFTIAAGEVFLKGVPAATDEPTGTDPTEENPTEPEPGPAALDVDADGEVTAADAREALRAALEIISLDGPSFAAADADADGEITAADARLILREAIG